MDALKLKESLKKIYEQYHKPEYIYPDPLYLVRRFSCKRVREIGGLIIALLAMGNVKPMLRALEDLTGRLDFLCQSSAGWRSGEMQDALDGFVYRFFTGKDIALLVNAIKRTLEEYGSLSAAFGSCLKPGDGTVIPALTGFAALLYARADGDISFLVPNPEKGSACKRLFLYLRWMVRKDEIDPGGWNDVPPSLLVVPVDTHMLQIAKILGLTNRKQADLKTALEITDAFRMVSPKDPVRYDFSLTRLGIHPDLGYELLGSPYK